MATGDKIRAVTVGAYVNTGTTETPVWTKLGGQKSATLKMSCDMDEDTTKDSTGNWQEVDPGTRSWSISCDCLKIDSDTGQAALETAFMTDPPGKVLLRWKEGSTAKWQGNAYISSKEDGAPEKGAATYKVEFTGTGAPTKDPTP